MLLYVVVSVNLIKITLLHCTAFLVRCGSFHYVLYTSRPQYSMQATALIKSNRQLKSGTFSQYVGFGTRHKNTSHAK